MRIPEENGATIRPYFVTADQIQSEHSPAAIESHFKSELFSLIRLTYLVSIESLQAASAATKYSSGLVWHIADNAASELFLGKTFQISA